MGKLVIISTSTVHMAHACYNNTVSDLLSQTPCSMLSLLICHALQRFLYRLFTVFTTLFFTRLSYPRLYCLLCFFLTVNLGDQSIFSTCCFRHLGCVLCNFISTCERRQVICLFIVRPFVLCKYFLKEHIRFLNLHPFCSYTRHLA